ARAIALLAAEDNAARLCGLGTRIYPLADQVTLELGQAGHDRAQELAAGRGQIEAEPGLRQNAHLPAVQVVKGLHQVLRASAPCRLRGDHLGKRPRASDLSSDITTMVAKYLGKSRASYLAELNRERYEPAMHQNSFDLLRLFAALSVFWGHQYT